MGLLGFNFDLTDQLAFYGSYHRNKWNQLIHFFFVPLIVWSVAVWACYTGPLVPHSQPPHFDSELLQLLSRYFVPNLAALLLALYATYYIVLEWFAGLTWTAFVALPVFVTANALQQHVAYAWAWAAGGFVLGWYAQIHPGHMMLEGRRPALLDSFFQSLVLAPLFVWMELLFLGGYRPRLQAQLKARIEGSSGSQGAAQKGQKEAQKEALLAGDAGDGAADSAAAE